MRVRTRPTAAALGMGVGILGILLLLAAKPVSAHEEYVVGEYDPVSAGEFLAEALTDPFIVGPLLIGGLAVGALAAAYLFFLPFQNDLATFRLAMGEYLEKVPWLLRISFGVPLIGAGFAGYFISPAVPADLRILQVALGFLLLFGLATRVIALVTLVVYLVGLVFEPLLLLQLEMIGGLLAIALIGSGQPSGDHVLQRMAAAPETVYGRFDPAYDYVRTLQERAEPYEQYMPTVTRIGLGITFIYLGTGQKLLRPGIALATVERYDLTSVVPVAPELWVLGAGLTETALGLALIFGLFTRASAATAISMFSLTLFALPDDPVLAHVALFGMASVLLITGGGPLSIDRRLSAWARRRKSVTRTEAPAAAD